MTLREPYSPLCHRSCAPSVSTSTPVARVEIYLRRPPLRADNAGAFARPSGTLARLRTRGGAALNDEIRDQASAIRSETPAGAQATRVHNAEDADYDRVLRAWVHTSSSHLISFPKYHVIYLSELQHLSFSPLPFICPSIAPKPPRGSPGVPIVGLLPDLNLWSRAHFLRTGEHTVASVALDPEFRCPRDLPFAHRHAEAPNDVSHTGFSRGIREMTSVIANRMLPCPPPLDAVRGPSREGRAGRKKKADEQRAGIETTQKRPQKHRKIVTLTDPNASPRWWSPRVGVEPHFEALVPTTPTFVNET
ncbi:hypothetical protein K438DRAFT_1751429 [Mycena galopus ATCC 62051]|nr:hypothetical protein K438DRAFT_1751429 [Mycena galopus ATCC 62051]